jgi:sn-glycerol 3-phosphate transport system substrate-binding protein
MIAAGAVKYGFTIGWQSWVLLENFGAWHDIPFATKENGFGGLDTEFVFNSLVHVKHIQRVADWQKDNVFRYGGRRGDGNPLFSEGECAMLINSSAYYGGLRKAANFEFGTAELPLDTDLRSTPLNSIIGGASLWVFKGHPKNENAGVAKFMTYLSDVNVQVYWHKNTGYVPITNAAYELIKSTDYYEKNEGRDVAIRQLSGKPTANSKGLRLGNFTQIRDIINEELEMIWAGKKSAQQGLDDAVVRGNKLLRKFEKSVK